jgi:hypothetical protein
VPKFRPPFEGEPHRRVNDGILPRLLVREHFGRHRSGMGGQAALASASHGSHLGASARARAVAFLPKPWQPFNVLVVAEEGWLMRRATGAAGVSVNGRCISQGSTRRSSLLANPSRSHIRAEELLAKATRRPEPTYLLIFEELWCYCNTLTILKKRRTAGRIAWSHTNAFQRIGGAS